jgi:hypothetical protein
MKPKDIPAIYQASFDNADVAFAVDLHDFPNFRKNLEKVRAVCLPRIDENPVRPRFRIGHIYEYAILKELTTYLSKEAAGQIVAEFFNEMKRRGRHLPRAEVVAIENASREAEYARNSSTGDIGNRLFVENPWLAFSTDFLDRSEERKQNPLLWIFPPQAHYAQFSVLATTESQVSVTGITEKFSKKLHGIYTNLASSGRFIDGNEVSVSFSTINLNSISTLNVTNLLLEVDRRLELRLHTRQLRGE